MERGPFREHRAAAHRATAGADPGDSGGKGVAAADGRGAHQHTVGMNTVRHSKRTGPPPSAWITAPFHCIPRTLTILGTVSKRGSGAGSAAWNVCISAQSVSVELYS